MNLQTSRTRLAAMLVAGVLSITGCAINGFGADNTQLTAESLPDGISYAWRQGGKVWFVPGRNSIIDDARTVRGDRLSLKVSGSYFTVDSAPAVFFVKVDGKNHQLRIPLQ